MTDEPELSLAVTRGEPTPEELAAVIAVLSETYAAEAHDANSADKPEPSEWMRTRRQMRSPLRRARGFGSWAR